VIRRLLAALLLCLVSTYAAADTKPHDLRSFARDAGLPDSVELTLVESETINGYFWRGRLLCQWFVCTYVDPFIGVLAPADWPREWVLAILFHEVGHYHQIREGVEPDEWDADVRSIRELCRLGLDGPAIHAEMLRAVWEQGGIVEDSPTHGNIFGRIENAGSRDCAGNRLAAPQAA
jgi:hypothetical protein